MAALASVSQRVPLECGDLSPLSAGDSSPSESDVRPLASDRFGSRGSVAALATARCRAFDGEEPPAESGENAPHSTTRRSPRLGYFFASCARSCWPVMLALFRSNSFNVPLAMTSPPCTPAPGPRSITQSAWRIVSSSCSTTSSELPRAWSFFSAPRSNALSRACRPMVGSSST